MTSTTHTLPTSAAARTNRPLLDGDEARGALEVAARIFARGLAWTTEHRVEAAETLGGFAGCLLVADALARAGRPLPRAPREIAREALVTSPDRRGLYDGRAGLLAVLDALEAFDPDGSAFARPRASLRAAAADDLLATEALDPADRDGYDLVRGAAGKLIALREIPDGVAAHACALLTAFAERAEEQLADPQPAPVPLDLGVAHGVAGILAALNVALPRERALARRYADLIVASSHVVDGARRWDSVWQRDAAPPPRRAWCYQTLGVAAVLHDRALLDGDGALRALALDALAATLREPEQPHWDDALCHGRSGAALIYARLGTDDERFAREAKRLARDVLRNHRDDAPFGYRAYNLIEGVEEDRPQFLDAALGIAMFLIEAAAPSQRRWLRLFGLLPGAPG
ncbi:MAG: hypothetical protein JOZ24_05920 [Candidatus Eremiobacteraeota bacterium]|nr:hypothetical protein [Candidatus Eremiobacteraeota bacterium]